MSSRFGKFSLVQRIGGGRLSQVFRIARENNSSLPLKVALKRVNPSLIGETDFVQLLVREAALLARLSHKNLCACQELGVIDGCAFFTLDLVDGCTLRALLRRISRLGAQLPPSAIIAIAYQLAEVLAYLHHHCEIPLVHLDLSPQNVMLSRDGKLKLIDFGITRQLDGRNPPPVGEKMIAGTVGYMSPEQARGAPLDGRADQFSLGILLWEMLADRRLFRGNTQETWQKMRGGQIPSVDEALRDAPEELSLLVMRMLQPEPAKRFATMNEVLLSLELCSSSPLSGCKPLAALIHRLLDEADFNPFDVPRSAKPDVAPVDIPQGERPAESYDDLRIEVDFGEGSPGSMVRQAVPDQADLPSSPYLETLPETDIQESLLKRDPLH
jgi:serine/threonine protein kinase